MPETRVMAGGRRVSGCEKLSGRVRAVLRPMNRIVFPELLDSLSPEDPRAVGSRRDLQRLNRRMHSADIIARALKRSFPGSPPRRLLELGGGDGTLLLAVAARLASQWRGVEAELLDQRDLLAPEISGRFSELGWSITSREADVLAWANDGDTTPRDAILANLFLHHFKQPELSTVLGAIAERASVFVALEPRRSTFFLVVTRLLWLMGCNAVTRHDARVSVRAGFRGRELSRLWPSKRSWSLVEERASPFSHLFLACSVKA